MGNWAKKSAQKGLHDNTFSFQLPIVTHSQVNAGFLIKDGKPLFTIGCYELSKDDAEQERMALAGVNLVRCPSQSNPDRVAAVGIL